MSDFSETIQHWNTKNNNNGLAQMNEGSSHRSRSRSRVTTTSATTTVPLIDFEVIVEVISENADGIVQSGVRRLQTFSQDCEEALGETIEDVLVADDIDVDGDAEFVSATTNDAGDLVVVIKVTVSVPCNTQDLEVCRAETEAAVDLALQNSISSGDIFSELFENLNEETNCANTGPSCETLLGQCGITEEFSFETDVCFTSEGDCRPTTSTSSTTVVSTSETSTTEATTVQSTTTPQTTVSQYVYLVCKVCI